MQNDNIKIPSVKESLSVHFKAIKDYIEYANNNTTEAVNKTKTNEKENEKIQNLNNI